MVYKRFRPDVVWQGAEIVWGYAMGARARIIGVLLCAVTFASGAQAQITTGVVYNPNSGELRIPVTAQVSPQCGFATAPNGSVTQPDFDVTGIPEADFTFQLECSGPSRVAIVSSNGGLMTGGMVPAGYATLAPYDVRLIVKANDSNDDYNEICSAEDLGAGGSCDFYGTASGTVGGFIVSPSVGQDGSMVQVSAPIYMGTDVLVDGTYNDTLTVTLSAAP